MNLIAPGTLYGDRVNEFDVRIAKVLRFGRTRTNVGFDIYNILNSNPVLTYNAAFIPNGSWLVPTRCCSRGSSSSARQSISSHFARRLFCAAALFSLAVAHVPAAAPDDLGERIRRLEQWLKHIARHEPGTPDATIVAISAWSNHDIELLRIDTRVLALLIRNPRLSSFQLPSREVECIDCFAGGGTRRSHGCCSPEERFATPMPSSTA